MNYNIKNKLRNMLFEPSKKNCAGILIKCTSTDNIFLLLRSDDSDEPNTWALVSGSINRGEDILSGLKREVSEELSIDPDIIDYNYIDIEYDTNKGIKFYYYVGFTSDEFIPTLNAENKQYGWFSKDSLPTPLYPNIESKIDAI